MAANQLSRKRKPDKSYNHCPQAMLNVVPANYTKIKFSDLSPGEDYEFKAIIGKVEHLFPIGKRAGGFVRKLFATDALCDSEENTRKMTIFLLDQFASDSDAAEIDGFIILTNFDVEKLTHQTSNDMPVQVLVKREESQVWFGRKVNAKEKKSSKSTNARKKQKITEEDELPAIVKNYYIYTKLGDLVETDANNSFNIYGVVDTCDLRVTSGKKMQILDLTLTDQTKTGFTCMVFAGGGETFPDVYPGDIVRLHRIQVNKFRSKLRGKCPNPKFILVFSKDNEGDKPRTVAKTFTFTQEDITRFRELFEWYRNKTAPKLICEIQRDDFANFVCQVIGIYIAKTTDAVILKVWDGTKTSIFPGTHWGIKEEKLDQRLFTLARNYYVNLSVYGHHTQKAAELEPGLYIEVKEAHLYSPRDNPDEFKLCLHEGNKENRGIFVLKETDEKVVQLKEKLDKVISDTLEYGRNQTQDLLSQNNSMFLNCDISVFTSTQQPSENGENQAADDPANVDEPVLPNEADIEVLNQPLPSSNAPSEKTVVSVVSAAIKPGQSTQEFGSGMPKDHNMIDEENTISATSEPDPTCNMTPMQTRYFYHDPLQLGPQTYMSIFPTVSNPEENEWWNSVPTKSVTDGHSNIKPTSLAAILQHSVPYKFRVFAVVLGYRPETTVIQKFIYLYCPKCSYISENASPSLDLFETRDGLSYYFCPKCSVKKNEEERPVLKYTFLISFLLHDGTGPPSVEAYVWKENAVKLFKGITPEEALRDSATADSILHMLWNICPNCRPFNSSMTESNAVYPVLDCCILSYHVENSNHYQIFDTILL